MTQIRFTEEFKHEAIRQVVDRGHPVVSKSLPDWASRSIALMPS